MGSSMSCVPHHNFRFSSKSFIRRNSSRLFRKKNPQEGQVKSNSIINILCTVTPRKDMSPKDLQTIENIKWDPPFAYDPSGGWKKSSINVKNYGRMVHSSKVRFRFLHCQDVHDCFLDLFQTHLHFVSNNPAGLTYQGTLPLKELTICNLQGSGGDGGNNTEDFAFQINGIGLNPIIVYCSSQKELDTWFSLLKEHVEANGGTVITAETRTYTRLKHTEDSIKGREDLRNSVKNEPIYEWEGSQRESLGPITYVTKVRLQHLPCQEQHDRLLVMYPATLIFLSEERNGLFYKGKLPLNTVSITTPCQDVKPNTFVIEGKMINPIVVSCLDENEFHDWIRHFKATPATVQVPPPPVYDIIYTPTKKEAPAFDRWSGLSSQGRKLSQNGRASYELPLHNHMDNILSPGYTEPLCYISSRPTSAETQLSARLSSRSNSVSSRVRPPPEPRPPSSLCYPSPQRYSCNSADGPLSPVYNMPYSSVYQDAPVQPAEKAPLIKSNSWSTPQTAMKHQLPVSQRYSDMCALRKPLSPLYDDPYTPGGTLWEDSYVQPGQVSAQHWETPTGPQLLPSSFRLSTPPLGRKYRNTPAPKQETERTEAVAKVNLPPTGHSSITPPILSSQSQRMSADYSQEQLTHLNPTKPDDQAVDYDNIWDVRCDTSMLPATSGFSPRRTLANAGRGDLTRVSAQKSWL
ncbi:probable pleckstrin homology domain-containing family N member 1 isoform X1 [Megalops cyprinoides]|uniref:probable pleckstrin homology domain-containing family N member 1 isoform X1 n=1 Tax=Megalops cyprinoides TaxID=118141 RepID=UPI001863B285|nr:probable pleckstrin homology domain-containing family N member 1 isoform X1 [Megalops cyprinoides]